MKTLKDQLTEVSDFKPYERQSNQACTILDKKELIGATAYLVEFYSENDHPFDAKGLRVVTVEEDYVYEIERASVKTLFNK